MHKYTKNATKKKWHFYLKISDIYFLINFTDSVPLSVSTFKI